MTRLRLLIAGLLATAATAAIMAAPTVYAGLTFNGID